jgi:hypothetical protein
MDERVNCAVCRNAIPIGHLFTAKTWFCTYLAERISDNVLPQVGRAR